MMVLAALRLLEMMSHVGSDFALHLSLGKNMQDCVCNIRLCGYVFMP